MRRRLSTVLILLVLTAAGGAGAGPREDLARAEAEQRARERERDRFARQAAQTAAQIEALRRQLEPLAQAQAANEARVGEQRRALSELNLRETQLTARLGGERNRLSRLLGALQMFRRNPPPALFVAPDDAVAAVRAAILIRAATPHLTARAKALSAQAAELKALRRRTAAASEAVFTSESALNDQRGRIEALIMEKTALERALAADILVADRDIQALAARAGSLRALTLALPAGPVAGAVAPAAAPAAKAFLTPVAGRLIKRFNPRMGSEGWTWRTAGAAQVRAPAAGTVEYAGPVKGWDLVLILRTGGDYHLVLAGLDAVLTGAGRTVEAGEPVARLAGAEPELYLEVRRGGAPVDPARWLDVGE